MLYIKLKDNYIFAAENVSEEVNGTFEAIIRFENVKPLAGIISTADIITHFDEENLGIIKICKDPTCTDVLYSFSIYKYLKGFVRTMNSNNEPVAVITVSNRKIDELVNTIVR